MSADWKNQTEEQLMEDAKERADALIKEAEEAARMIYVTSLEYVDDMLAEVQLIALRAKENMRIVTEAMLEDFDLHINLVEQHKADLLKQLHELSENGQRPRKKASYHIKIDEAYLPKKQSYAVKSNDGSGESIEVHKAAKQPYEIKIADEWKGRVEEMLAAANEPEPFIEQPELPEMEEEEGYQASDFDLDAEYFLWLEEQKKQK